LNLLDCEPGLPPIPSDFVDRFDLKLRLLTNCSRAFAQEQPSQSDILDFSRRNRTARISTSRPTRFSMICARHPTIPKEDWNHAGLERRFGRSLLRPGSNCGFQTYKKPARTTQNRIQELWESRKNFSSRGSRWNRNRFTTNNASIQYCHQPPYQSLRYYARAFFKLSCDAPKICVVQTAKDQIQNSRVGWGVQVLGGAPSSG